MVFQSPAVLPFSIGKNLAMPLRVTLGLAGAALSERMEWALREVSLWDEEGELVQETAGQHLKDAEIFQQLMEAAF